MADFSALKTSIQNYIKQNGNEEITGNLLQQILLSMVTTLGDSAINDLVTALNAEIANRGNADTELGGRITTLQGVVNGIKANVENGYVYAGIATPSTTPVSGKVFYLALTSGTYTNFGAAVVPQGINILKYNGSAWSLDSFLGLDDAPTQGSSNLVKSGGVLDSIIKDGSAFDLSAYNSGTTYADLSAALTALNALPAAYKKGGMSVKFVQSSDNKYVQYRLMKNTWSTTVSDWQGVDDEPTAGSDNLVKSGGVMDAIAYEVGIETLFDTYSMYNVNSGTVGNVSEGTVSQYHASQKIKIIGRGDITTITCSIPYNVMMFWDEQDNYLGWNRTGAVITGATTFVVGFNNENPFIAGASVITGGLIKKDLDNQISIVNQSINTAKQDCNNHTDKLSLLDNSLIGFNLTQNIEVTSGQASGNINAFAAGSLALNDTIYFCLVDNNHCVDKYAIVTNYGTHIVSGSGSYIYSPNVVYKKTVIYGDIASSKWGCYIDASNCIGNGSVKFFCSKDSALIKYIKENFYDNIELQIETIENNIKNVRQDIIGFERLYQVYHEYNVHSGNLTPGTQSDAFVASQKIYLQEGQTEVKCSFVVNAYLFYDEQDNYLGWNRTSNVLNGSAYVIIGLDYLQEFDNQMYYYLPSNTNILNRISNLEQSVGKSNLWKNKTFAVLGDSLSENHVWENRFAELTGAVYLQGYSKGGEPTISASGNCEMDRALRLLAEHPNVNAIFIQNINDKNLSAGDGQITDLPYMMTQNILSSTLYGSAELALQALESEIANIGTPKIGTMLRIKYGTTAKKLTIGNTPSANGTITITIGSTDYAVTVNSAMSIQDIQNAILAYDYSGMGYADTDSSTNAVLFTDTENRGSSAPTISVDAGTTGVTLTLTDSTSVSYVARCFISKDIQEWQDTTKWISMTSIKRYQLYKGLISWLQTEFPNAYIFMLGLPRYVWNDNPNAYKYADGTYDWDAYRTPVAIQYLFDCQKTVADYMRIPYVDVVNACAINIYNASVFYPKSDVHPMTVGYQRWGETVARLLK